MYYALFFLGTSKYKLLQDVIKMPLSKITPQKKVQSVQILEVELTIKKSEMQFVLVLAWAAASGLILEF